MNAKPHKTSTPLLWTLTALYLLILNPPQTRSAVISDFNDGVQDWNQLQCRGACFSESGGQLVASGNIPAKIDCVTWNLSYARWLRSLTAAEGEVLRIGVDLVEANQNDAQVLLSFLTPGIGGYSLVKDQDEIWLTKYRWVDCGANAPFFYQSGAIKNEGIRLVLELRRVGSSLEITSKVLDLDDNAAILFEKTVTDTMAVDPTVSYFHGYIWSPDSGPPLFDSTMVGVDVINAADVPLSNVRIAFDNFSYDRQPVLQVERVAGNAVRLSWPASFPGLNLLGASDIDGPWSPVTEPAVEEDGVYRVTIPEPVSNTARVFRLETATP